VGGGNSDVVHSNRNAKGQVIALDRKMGRILWQVTMEDSVLGAIACRDEGGGGGMALCPCRTGEVIALSLRDGQELWRTRVSGSSPVIGGCGFTDQRAYAVSADGYLAAMDPKTGKILEKVFLNDPAKPGSGLTASGPVVSGGRIYIGTETGGFRCFGGTENVGGRAEGLLDGGATGFTTEARRHGGNLAEILDWKLQRFEN
jgi:outer membrane protein assembly factor BamB